MNFTITSHINVSGKQKVNPKPNESKMYEKINEILKNILKFFRRQRYTNR